MASFYDNYQNPFGFCFLMLIRAIVLCSPLGLQNLNLKRKTKRILIVVVKAGFHMIADRRSQIVIRSAIVCNHMETTSAILRS